MLPEHPQPQIAAGPGIRAIKDQVIVRQDKPRDRHESGLYLPDQCARELQDDYATVLAIGPGVDAAEIRPNMRVLFKRRADSALIPDRRERGPSEWEDILVLREEDILGEAIED